MSNSSEFDAVTGFEEARPFLASLRTAGQGALVMAEIDVYIVALAFLHGDLSTLYQVVLVLLVGSLVCSLVFFGVAYLDSATSALGVAVSRLVETSYVMVLLDPLGRI